MLLLRHHQALSPHIGTGRHLLIVRKDLDRKLIVEFGRIAKKFLRECEQVAYSQCSTPAQAKEPECARKPEDAQ